jgi:hypothetical protein
VAPPENLEGQRPALRELIDLAQRRAVELGAEKGPGLDRAQAEVTLRQRDDRRRRQPAGKHVLETGAGAEHEQLADPGGGQQAAQQRSGSRIERLDLVEHDDGSGPARRAPRGESAFGPELRVGREAEQLGRERVLAAGVLFQERGENRACERDRSAAAAIALDRARVVRGQLRGQDRLPVAGRRGARDDTRPLV